MVESNFNFDNGIAMASYIQCAAVLFDLDGVLVYSADSLRRAWRQWAREHGFELSVVESASHGRRTVDTIRRLAPEIDADRAAAELEAAQALDVADVLAGRGARELLNCLGVDEWAVVTSGTRRPALARIQAAGLPEPTVLVTGDDVNNGKPDPEGYLLASMRLGYEPSACVVIEDAGAGVQAARQAGMRVIGLTNGEEGTQLAGADMIINSCEDIHITRNPGSAADGQIIITTSGQLV
jgi:mannitol-1-/sugar-/sorbitol-6-phosphatase